MTAHDDTESIDARDVARARLASADDAFDGSPEGRLRALATYAENARWIDPTTPEGAERTSRILADPRTPDPRFRSLLAFASEYAADARLRFRALFASVRWAIVDEEFDRAEASLRQGLGRIVRIGAPLPPAGIAMQANLMTVQRRETEALALVTAVRRAVAESGDDDPVAAAFVAEHACAMYVVLGAFDAAMDQAVLTERLRRATPKSDLGMSLISLARHRAFAALGAGDTAAAQHWADGIDLTLVSESELRRTVGRVGILQAEIHLAEDRPQKALALAVASANELGAVVSTEMQGLAIGAVAAARLGRPDEALAHAHGVIARIDTATGSVSAASALESVGRAVSAVAGFPRSGDVLAEARRRVATDLGIRVRELTDLVVRDGGLRHVAPPDLAHLVRFRRRFAKAWSDRARLLGADLVPCDSAAFARVDQSLGGLGRWTSCASCLRLWGPDGEPMPVGHLLGDTLRASLRQGTCPSCADATSSN